MNKKRFCMLMTLIIIVLITLTACNEKKLDEESLEVINKSIKNTSYNDFSFAELMDNVNLNNEIVTINDLNITVDNKGYINTFNIIYFLGSSKIKNHMMYRRKSDMFKILETNTDNEYANQELNNTKILHIVDGSFKLEDIEKEDYELYMIDLLSAGKIKSEYDKLPVYYNGMLIKNRKAKNIEALAFYTYTYPIIKENDDFSVYIFDYN